MPVFFTHIVIGTDLAEDVQGQHFASLDDARQSALEGSRIVLANLIRGGENSIQLEYRVQDDAGNPLDTIAISVVVQGLD